MDFTVVDKKRKLQVDRAVGPQTSERVCRPTRSDLRWRGCCLLLLLGTRCICICVPMARCEIYGSQSRARGYHGSESKMLVDILEERAPKSPHHPRPLVTWARIRPGIGGFTCLLLCVQAGRLGEIKNTTWINVSGSTLFFLWNNRAWSSLFWKLYRAYPSQIQVRAVSFLWK